LYQTKQELEENEEKIRGNAHYKKFCLNYEEAGSFFIVKGGTKKSKRYKNPVRVDRAFCNNFLTDIQGRAFNWKDESKFDNQVIGSYTRTIRSILDSERNPGKFQKFLSKLEEMD